VKTRTRVNRFIALSRVKVQTYRPGRRPFSLRA